MSDSMRPAGQLATVQTSVPIARPIILSSVLTPQDNNVKVERLSVPITTASSTLLQQSTASRYWTDYFLMHEVN